MSILKYIWRENPQASATRSKANDPKSKNVDITQYISNLLKRTHGDTQQMIRIVWGFLWRIDASRWISVVEDLEKVAQTPVIAELLKKVRVNHIEGKGQDSINSDDREQIARSLRAYLWAIDARQWKQVMEALKKETPSWSVAANVVEDVMTRLKKDNSLI